MEVIVLADNTSAKPEIEPVAGLSFYISTTGHKLLFDVGPDETFSRNARRLGISLSDIDSVIISHGHNDHGGGLTDFLAENSRATVHLHQKAFGSYYDENAGLPEYIGLEHDLEGCPQFHLAAGDEWIDENLLLIADVENQTFHPPANDTLLKKTNQGFVSDCFDHEQSLLVRENGDYYLFAGCAHNGITNILRKAEAICGSELKAVFGGFHFWDFDTGISEAEDKVAAVAAELKKRSAAFYTCHCTGMEAFQILQQQMGNQIQYLAAGMRLSF